MKEIFIIIFLHIMLFVVNVYMWGIVEGGSFLMSICAFLTEPLITFVTYVVLQYFIIRGLFEKGSLLSRKERIRLTIISIICSLISLQPSVSTYIETIVEDGFSIFIFKDWWT